MKYKAVGMVEMIYMYFIYLLCILFIYLFIYDIILWYIQLLDSTVLGK